MYNNSIFSLLIVFSLITIIYMTRTCLYLFKKMEKNSHKYIYILVLKLKHNKLFNAQITDLFAFAQKLTTSNTNSPIIIDNTMILCFEFETLQKRLTFEEQLPEHLQKHEWRIDND